jgi:hypothetical protein
MIRARARVALCHPREKHTPTKCNLLFFLSLSLFPFLRYRRTRFSLVDGRTRVRTGTVPTSFIKRVGRRPRRSIWRQIDCNTAVSPKCIPYKCIRTRIHTSILYNSRKRRSRMAMGCGRSFDKTRTSGVFPEKYNAVYT